MPRQISSLTVAHTRPQIRSEELILGTHNLLIICLKNPKRIKNDNPYILLVRKNMFWGVLKPLVISIIRTLMN